MVDTPTTATSTMATTRSSAKRPRVEDEHDAAPASRPPPPLRVSPRPASAPAGIATAAKPDKIPDDLDPSLMTERQQIAFLLRQSAQAMTASSDDSDEDRKPPRTSARPTKSSAAMPVSVANKENDTSRRRKPAPKRPSPIARSSMESTSAMKMDTTRCCLCTSWTDSLFLCGHCDKKYPTQKALGHAV